MFEGFASADLIRSGMDELIRAVLMELANGPNESVVQDIAIVSNSVRYDATGKWFITWRHPERYVYLSISFLPFSPQFRPPTPRSDLHRYDPAIQFGFLNLATKLNFKLNLLILIQK